MGIAIDNMTQNSDVDLLYMTSIGFFFIVMLALITAYAIFLAVSGGRPVLFLALLIFTVIAAEGRIGLAFLLKARRQCSPRIEKRGV